MVVRVVSDRLAADIRDAVKRGMARAAPDIDDEGEAAGKRMAAGVNRGVKEKSDSIGKELEVYARRFVAGVDGVFDDGGRKIGQRFGDSIADGIRKNEGKTRDAVDQSVSRALTLRSGSAIDKIGRDLGTRFSRAIGDGVADSDIGKELAIRDTGLERQGNDTGRRFGRAIGAGFSGTSDDIWNDVRRSFNMRPGDIDADGESNGRRFGDGLFNGFRSQFTKLRNAADQAAQNMSAGLGRGFRRAQAAAAQAGQNVGNGFTRGFARARVGAQQVSNNISSGFTRSFTQARASGQSFFRSMTLGFRNLRNSANSSGNAVGNGFSNNIRNGANRNRGSLLSLFSGLGGDLGKHFNLGIGASKMGEAIVSILATAGPSLIAGAAAIGTAMAAEIIVAMAAIGPGLGGAIGVGIAGVSTLALNFGLLLAAFKASGTVLDDVKKRFKAVAELIGTPIAEGMLAGLTDTVDILNSSLPELNGILTKTGEAFGNAARKIAETVTSAENMSRIKGILATNVTFIDNFKDGISGLVTSFLILFNASKPFIDFIGEGIKRFGEWAAASLAVSEANGNLAAWMDGMLASFKDLWAIVKNFAGGISNVFSAAAPAGESLLGSIRGIAERFHAWTSDEGNMARMTAFFDKAHTLASAVFDVLGAIFTAGGKAFEGMDLGPILHVLDTLENVVAPAIARIFNQIQAGASDNLVKAFDNIGTAVGKIADSGSFQKVAEFMSNLFLQVTNFAASDFGSTILAWVIPIALLGGAVTSLLGPLIALGKGLFGIVSLLPAISAPALAVVAAIAGVAAVFATMYANSESLRTAIGNLVSAVGGTLMEIWDKLAPKLEVIWEKFQKLAGVIGDRLAPVIEFLTPVVQRVFNFIGDALGTFLDLAGGFIDILIGIFTGDWGKIWEGVQEVFKAVWDAILNTFGFVKDALSIIWDGITAVIYNAGQVIYGVVSTAFQGVWSVITTVWNAIYEFFNGILTTIADAIRSFGNAIPGFLAGIWATVSGAVVTAWNAVFDFFNTILTNIADGIRSFGNGIPGFLAGIWEDVRSAVVNAWNAVFDFFNGILTDIADGIRGFGDDIQTVWNNIVGGIHTAWDGLASTVSGIWDGVKDAIWTPIMEAYNQVKAWIDPIVTAVTSVIDTVTGAFETVTSIVGSIFTAQASAATAAASTALGAQAVLGKGILDPVIPALARGGIIAPSPGGTLVRVAEARRPERVDPIQRNGLTARDESLIRMMSAQLATVGAGSNDVNVNVSLSERSLEAFVTSVIKRNDSNNARRVGRVRPT